MAIKASRGGVSSPYWYQQDIPVIVQPSPGSITMHLELGSKGGGQTAVMLSVGPEDFEELLAAMLDSDFDGTLKSFAVACQKWRRVNAKSRPGKA
jgi:hypothetical protein